MSRAGGAMREIIKTRLQLGGEAGAALKGDYDLNPPAPRGRELTSAAVLVPLVDRPEGMMVLLTQRTEHLSDHPGQISFPGGRMEAHDRDPEATALRETEEEIGRLDHYETVTGFLVTPVVGLVTPGFALEVDRVEVADVFEVPLAFILDPSHHERHSRTVNGRERHFYVIPYEQRFIWGATAGMLVNLFRRLSA